MISNRTGWRALILAITVILWGSFFSVKSSQGGSGMSSERLSHQIVSALTAMDLEGFMTLVARDIVCEDGSTFEELRHSLSSFFNQMDSLKVETLTIAQADSAHLRIKIPLNLALKGGQTHPLTLFITVSDRAGEGRITDLYDEAGHRRRNLEIYRTDFNREGLPEVVSRLVAWRCGVWVGPDIELVLTRKMEIRFQRDSRSLGGLWSQFSLLRYTGSGFEQHIRALAYANRSDKTLKTYARNLGSFSEDQPYLTDPGLAGQVVLKSYHIVSSGDTEIVLETGDGERERVLDSGIIEHFDALGKLTHRLKRVETVDVLAQKPAHQKLSESTVGHCLRSWQMGARLDVVDGEFKRAVVVTGHHDYVFEIREGFCYCRASRYETCEKGMVGAQNIRLMVNPNEFTSFMMAENEKVAGEKLIVDESLFNPDACVFTSKERGGWTAGIYWSVKSASDDLIELHGCGGDTYRYDRPRGVTDKTEWFR